MLLKNCVHSKFVALFPCVNLSTQLQPCIKGRTRNFVAHRALYSGKYGENTFAAIQDCVESGVPQIEIDLQILKDEKFVLFHDFELDRLTNAKGLISNRDTAYISSIPYKTGEPIALLDDILPLLLNSSLRVHLDLKISNYPSSVIGKLAKKILPLKDRMVIASQDYQLLEMFTDHGFSVAFDTSRELRYQPNRPPGKNPVGLGLHGLWDDSFEAYDTAISTPQYIRYRLQSFSDLMPLNAWVFDADTLDFLTSKSPTFSRDLAQQGIDLITWGLDDTRESDLAKRLHCLFDIGVATVITDFPEKLASYALNNL